jgi:hypothetical protein
VGLMCSLLLIEHLSYLGGGMARLMVRTRHQNDACYDEIGLCAQNIHTILGSIGILLHHNWDGLCDCLKRNMVFILTS